MARGTDDEKRPPRKLSGRARVEWGSSHADKPHRDALEHARPPVKDQPSDNLRDRETVLPDPGSRHPQ